MFDLYELQAFVEFSKCGTLSKTAENLHISQPTLTRTMKHIEDEFGVGLFVRTKNRIELNESGVLAADRAQKLLDSAQDMVRQIRRSDEKRRTITIETCAPAPLWGLVPEITSDFPDGTVSAGLKKLSEILEDLRCGDCRIGIAAISENETTGPWKEMLPEKDYCFVPYIHENLYLSLGKDHPLASKKKVSFSEINGLTFLVRPDLGYWDELQRKMLPDSKFLVQNEESNLFDLLTESTIPGFVTNISMRRVGALKDRAYVPVTDPAAHTIFYLICRRDDPAADFIRNSGEEVAKNH